jgi:hypothetical protein
MEDSIPSTTRLFAQLGLSSAPNEIDVFIAAHKPLSANVSLYLTPRFGRLPRLNSCAAKSPKMPTGQYCH